MAPRSSSTSPTKKPATGGNNNNNINNGSGSKISLPRKSFPAPLTRLKFIPQRPAAAARQQLPASLAQAGPNRATSIRMASSPSPSASKLAVPSSAASSPSAAPLSPGGVAGLRQLRLLNASTVDLPGTAGASAIAAAAASPAGSPIADRSPPPSRLPLAVVPSGNTRKPVPPARNPARPSTTATTTTTTFLSPVPASPSSTPSKLPRVRGFSPPSPPPRFPPPKLPLPAAYIPAGARRGVSAPVRFLTGGTAGAAAAGSFALPPVDRSGRGLPPRWPIPNFSRPLWRRGAVGGGGGDVWPQRSSSLPVAPAGPVGVALSESWPGRLSLLEERDLMPFEEQVEEEKEEEEERGAWPLPEKPLPPLPKKDN